MIESIIILIFTNTTLFSPYYKLCEPKTCRIIITNNHNLNKFSPINVLHYKLFVQARYFRKLVASVTLYGNRAIVCCGGTSYKRKEVNLNLCEVKSKNRTHLRII